MRIRQRSRGQEVSAGHSLATSCAMTTGIISLISTTNGVRFCKCFKSKIRRGIVFQHQRRAMQRRVAQRRMAKCGMIVP